MTCPRLSLCSWPGVRPWTGEVWVARDGMEHAFTQPGPPIDWRDRWRPHPAWRAPAGSSSPDGTMDRCADTPELRRARAMLRAERAACSHVSSAAIIDRGPGYAPLLTLPSSVTTRLELRAQWAAAEVLRARDFFIESVLLRVERRWPRWLRGCA